MPCDASVRALLDDHQRFTARIISCLQTPNNLDLDPGLNPAGRDSVSVVFFLLGMHAEGRRSKPEPCLLLNKRSSHVRQPGDLCCPGGGIAPRCDGFVARLLRLPGSPLSRWPGYAPLKRHAPRQLRHLSLLMATALREGVEEMRLNPLDVRFLGRLPSERLVMFKRVIHPLVGWSGRFQRLSTNWEVERIVWIPVHRLLDEGAYIRLRITMGLGADSEGRSNYPEFPAFRYITPHGSEVLWGATYRITMEFLKQVLGFTAPDAAGLPIVAQRLSAAYLTGNG